MKLTKNFDSKEFDCKDGTPVPKELIPNVKELAENLQVLRNVADAPVKITGSGYRTPSHNKKVKGAPKSLHLQAKAGDINIDGYTPNETASLIEKLISDGQMKQGGIGIYPPNSKRKGFVHYDTRGTKARWNG